MSITLIIYYFCDYFCPHKLIIVLCFLPLHAFLVLCLCLTEVKVSLAKYPQCPLCFCGFRCENSLVTIQSSVSKSALKEKEQEKSVQGPKKTGAQQNKNKDIDKFHLYFDFTCNVQRIQPHQVVIVDISFIAHPSIVNKYVIVCGFLKIRN